MQQQQREMQVAESRLRAAELLVLPMLLERRNLQQLNNR